MAVCIVPGTSYIAHASGTTQTLTPQETRDLIGSTISAKCYDGSGYTDFSFSYGGTTQVVSVTASPTPGITAGDTVLYYVADLTTVSTDPQFITCDIRPEYSFFDTQTVYQYIALSSNYSYPTPATSAYAPPSWRWHDSLTGDKIFESDATYNNGANYGYFRCAAGGSTWDSTFVEASISSQSDFSAYSYRACFYGNSLQNGRYVLFISCPVVSSDSTMASGTGIGTTSSGGGSGDITVNVDMTQTNGLLDSILQAIEGVVDAIAGLFVPSEDALTDFKDDMQDLLAEHLGGLYDAEQAVEDYAQTIADADTTATQTIRFPALAIPLGSATFRLGPYDIPLKPYAQDFSILWDALALAIDIIVTTAFINMCRKKLEIFLHPDGEVIVS